MNNNNNIFNNSSRNNDTLMLVIKIVIFLAIMYGIYWLYSFYSNRKVRMKDSREMIKNVKNAKNYSLVKAKDIPTSSFSNEYAISFWVYLDDYNYKFKKAKNVLLKGKRDGSNGNPEIYFEPINNNMVVKIKLQSETYNDGFADTTSNIDGFGDVMASDVTATEHQDFNDVLNMISTNNATNSTVEFGNNFFSMVSGNVVESFQNNNNLEEETNEVGDENDEELENNNNNNASNNNNNKTVSQPELTGYDTCTLDNVKLQRWTHIVVSVYNNIVDIYYDGKLKKSCVLKGFPEPNTNDLHLSLDGGFSGKIAKMNYINAAINQNEAYSIYRVGPVYRASLWDTISGWFM